MIRRKECVKIVYGKTKKLVHLARPGSTQTACGKRIYNMAHHYMIDQDSTEPMCSLCEAYTREL